MSLNLSVHALISISLLVHLPIWVTPLINLSHRHRRQTPLYTQSNRMPVLHIKGNLSILWKISWADFFLSTVILCSVYVGADVIDVENNEIDLSLFNLGS